MLAEPKLRIVIGLFPFELPDRLCYNRKHESTAKSLQTHRGDAANAEFRGVFLLNFSAKLRALCASAVKLTFLQWTQQLVNSTVEDVSMREAVGYDAVLGALDRQVEVKVNWSEIDELGTIGIDEIAMTKGRKNYAAVVTSRQKNGQTRVLAVLPDRKKQQ